MGWVVLLRPFGGSATDQNKMLVLFVEAKAPRNKTEFILLIRLRQPFLLEREREKAETSARCDARNFSVLAASAAPALAPSYLSLTSGLLHPARACVLL